MNITDCFIDELVTKSQVLPERIIEQAKRCLEDYFGVLIGGRRYVNDVHSDLFEAFDGATPYKALVNGFCAHALELDDGHRLGMIHLGASIITAILEVAVIKQIQFERILCGISMGYEAAVRCAKALQPNHKMRGFHVSGTCGVIGASIGVAFASGYSRAQLKSTLDCAVSSAAGVLEIQEQSSEMKPYNVGRAAMDGVVSAQMGGLGMLGPDDILGGKRGFLAALTDTPHVEMLTVFNDEEYAIEGIYQKVHAACRHCHPAIDAALDLKERIRFTPEQIDRIEVHTYRLAVGSHDHIDIKGISSAKLSTPYSVALALVEGSAGYANYNDLNLRNNKIISITQKVRVIEDEELSRLSPAIRGAKVFLYLKGGGVYESQCLYPKGEPENPLSKSELDAKFLELASYGGLSEQESKLLIDSIWNYDDSSIVLNLIREWI